MCTATYSYAPSHLTMYVAMMRLCPQTSDSWDMMSGLHFILKLKYVSLHGILHCISNLGLAVTS